MFYLNVQALIGRSMCSTSIKTVRWPSGLRRQLKALVREGVGSNPTAIIAALCTLSLWPSG